MRITVVSRSWPSTERSGVSLIAAQHVLELTNAGHEVSIVGSNIDPSSESLPVSAIYKIPSEGSGALYSRGKVDLSLLRSSLRDSCPELVVVESFQTALTDAAVDVSFELGIPILMISHGISIYPYTLDLFNLLRAFGWIYYRIKSLPNRISKLSAITTLNEESSSNRFFDRIIAQRLGIPIVPLVNSPINWCDSVTEYSDRKHQILVVGYFSAVKNQLAALDVFASLPEGLQLRFIGQREGRYYLKCLKRVAELGLSARVTFAQDDEINIADEIAYSLVVLCTSITEALPVTLLEAMASGTPFVATAVGAIPNMGAGVIARNKIEQQRAILSLISDVEHWSQTSDKGRQSYLARYTRSHVKKNLLDAVSIATKSKRPTSS